MTLPKLLLGRVLELALRKEWRRVILEGDSLNVIMALKSAVEAVSWEANSTTYSTL
ncbi:LOW QUALITY PROTEIN: hypothetical protein PanWU01x14_010590 [Parasponia andersonii]|uniref:RNase H type-1 domain-containing protein n=1 Tax=Parasponia andersonii TaxID=3476 RepID=A0A2P5E2T7_PARAD|nr:LOW QUALITY PROTEIN: hypothetical protein PanWU01x14_010590 [Parasponia andersonii]